MPSECHQPGPPVGITPAGGERGTAPICSPPVSAPPKPTPAPGAPADRRGATLAAIGRLRRRANHGLLVLAAFLLLSVVALDDFSFLPSLPPALRDALGKGPTPDFISMALVVYLFSAVIMALARMMSGDGKTGGVTHLGYLGAFYAFFQLSGTLADNVWAVAGSGITILGLETYQLWNYCQEEIRREEETLRQLDRQRTLDDESTVRAAVNTLKTGANPRTKFR